MVSKQEQDVVATLISALERARGFIANDTASDPEMVAAELANIDQALTIARSRNQ